MKTPKEKIRGLSVVTSHLISSHPISSLVFFVFCLFSSCSLFSVCSLLCSLFSECSPLCSLFSMCSPLFFVFFVFCVFVLPCVLCLCVFSVVFYFSVCLCSLFSAGRPEGRKAGELEMFLSVPPWFMCSFVHCRPERIHILRGSSGGVEHARVEWCAPRLQMRLLLLRNGPARDLLGTQMSSAWAELVR